MGRLKMSPAMAVALTALFVALGGTGYAVTSLPRNSVGTHQLRTAAVTTKKIKKHAVTASRVAGNTLGGAQIAESRLGTVPRAGDAATVGGLAPSAFLGSGRVAFGTGVATSVVKQQLISLPELGITVTTDGDADPGPDVVANLPNANWFIMDENDGSQMFSMPAGGELALTAQPEVANVRSSYVSALVWQTSINRGMYLRCTFDTHGFTTARPIACWALRV